MSKKQVSPFFAKLPRDLLIFFVLTLLPALAMLVYGKFEALFGYLETGMLPAHAPDIAARPGTPGDFLANEFFALVGFELAGLLIIVFYSGFLSFTVFFLWYLLRFFVRIIR